MVPLKKCVSKPVTLSGHARGDVMSSNSEIARRFDFALDRS